MHFCYIVPMLKISVNTSVVNATIGDTVKLICKLECFCIGATLMWERNYSNPLPNNTMVWKQQLFIHTQYNILYYYTGLLHS